MDRYAAAARRTAALEDWLLLFFTCSSAGWLWEVLLTAAATGRWVNRGLLHGPWLPVYGAGGVLLAAALGRFRRDPAAALALGALLGGGVEYATALILEQWYHRRWWDYTGWTGSIQGRVCLASLTGFALADVFEAVKRPGDLPMGGAPAAPLLPDAARRPPPPVPERGRPVRPGLGPVPAAPQRWRGRRRPPVNWIFPEKW